MNDNLSAYTSKPRDYFTGARCAFVDPLPRNPEARLLEIGCGSGATCAYALANAKCGTAVGVDLCPVPASELSDESVQIHIGDIELIDLPYPPGFFDILILSEVLEHLHNPSGVLRKLHPLLKRGATVLAGSPNVAYWQVLLMLLRGRWDYECTGIMDHTHLRWFTPATYRELFENSGFRVDICDAATPLRWKAAALNHLAFGRFKWLLHSQIVLKARKAER